MLRLILGRIAAGAATLLVASALIFTATQLLPGDLATATLGRDATPAAVAQLRETLGLDRPGGAALPRLARRHRTARSRQVGGQQRPRERHDRAAPAQLGAARGGDAGAADPALAAARHRDRAATRLRLRPRLAARHGRCSSRCRSSSSASCSCSRSRSPGRCSRGHVPGQAEGLVLPGRDAADAVARVHGAHGARGVIEVLSSEYVAMARLKGMPERSVIRHHVLPNAIGPSLHAFALTAAWLAGGVVIVEYLFAYPGHRAAADRRGDLARRPDGRGGVADPRGRLRHRQPARRHRHDPAHARDCGRASERGAAARQAPPAAASRGPRRSAWCWPRRSS